MAPDDPLDAVAEPVTYEVVEGRVGRSLTFTAVAEWELAPLARFSGSGTVTSVDIADGDEVAAGQQVLSVDLRPVVVAEGAVPMFRDLSVRSEGEDVAQLQELLTTLGFYDGEVDGDFGSGMRAAVRDWQDSLGLDDDGVVRRSDVIFVPSLPARVALGEDVAVGAPLSGGEQVLWLIPDSPLFRIPLAIDQRALVPLAAPVNVTYPDGVWAAQTTQAVESPEQGQLDLILEGTGGGPVCAQTCSQWLSLTGRTDFRAEVVVIPETSGQVVPVAAITTSTDGTPQVTMADGTLRNVTVVESSDGLAVVDGVEVGAQLQLPFSEAPDPAVSG